MPNPLEILSQLAKRFNQKISPINLFDANVCTWTHPPGRPWESKIVSGEKFLKRLRYEYRGHKIRAFANRYFLIAEVTGSFAMERLSINRTDANDPLLTTAKAVKVNGKQYPAFTRSGALTSKHVDLLASNAFKALANELDLQSDESLHFATDSISLYFSHLTLSRITKAIEGLITLAESISQPAAETDLSALPLQFHPLIPLIKKWAIDDDSNREDFLESIPRGMLKRFVEEVEPYLKSIDSYLDSYGKQLPSEEACALGRLAECAAEARKLFE